MLAIVCPGQGSQTPGFLAPWLELDGTRDLLASLSDAAGVDLIRHGTESDEETIKDTAVAQPLIVAAGLVAAAALEADAAAPESTVVAGHSVGEITAAAVTGVLSPAEALSLVRVRATGMARAAAATPTGMAAVVGGDQDEVLTAIEAAGLTPANVNESVVADALPIGDEAAVCRRLLHRAVGGMDDARRVECGRDRGEIVARRAVLEHVTPRAEGVLRYRAEMAELGTMLLRPLRRRNEIVGRNARAAPRMGPRP